MALLCGLREVNMTTQLVNNTNYSARVTIDGSIAERQRTEQQCQQDNKPTGF